MSVLVNVTPGEPLKQKEVLGTEILYLFIYSLFVRNILVDIQFMVNIPKYGIGIRVAKDGQLLT